MAIKNTLIQFINLTRRIFQTFFLSIIKTKTFFLTDKYQSVQVDGKLYLYLSLLLYLIFYSTLQSYEFSFFLRNVDRFTVSVNIVELIFLTIPLFLYCVLLSKLQVVSYKNPAKARLYYITLIVFSNALFLEAGLHFLNSLIVKLLPIIQTDTNIKIDGSLISKIILFLSDAGLYIIPLYIFSIISDVNNKNIKLSMLLFLPITVCATNIAFTWYRYEFLLLKDPKEIAQKRVEFINKETLYADGWNLQYFITNPDTAEISTTFFIKNNTDIDYIGDPKSFRFSATNDEVNKKKNDTLFLKFRKLIEERPFDEVYINEKLCNDYFLIKPKELLTVKIGRKIPYDFPNAVLLQQISLPAFSPILYSFQFEHDIRPIKDGLDSNYVYSPTIKIGNFTEDRISLNKYFKAEQTYIKADSALGWKRLDKNIFRYFYPTNN